MRGAVLVALAALVAFGGALGVARLLREPPPEPTAQELERVALSGRSATVRKPAPAAKVPALRPRPRPKRTPTPTPTAGGRDPIRPDSHGRRPFPPRDPQPPGADGQAARR